MFCPRCGRNLSEGDNFCPECGYFIRDAPVQAEPAVRDSGISRIMFLLVGFAAMFLLSYFVGFFFLFFFIPVLTIGGGRSKWQMLFIGAMLGTVAALVMRYLF